MGCLHMFTPFFGAKFPARAFQVPLRSHYSFTMAFQFIPFFLLALLAVPSRCAFTITSTAPYAFEKDTVKQNSARTWCYYPATKPVHNTQCTGVRSDQEKDFSSVLNTHLNQTISIGYYTVDAQRLGGAEWVFTTSAGPVRICLSGRAGDGTYETRCGNVVADNSLGSDSGHICRLATGQYSVTDGCYEPGQQPDDSNGAPPAVTPGSSPTPPAGSLSKSSGYKRVGGHSIGSVVLILLLVQFL